MLPLAMLPETAGQLVLAGITAMLVVAALVGSTEVIDARRVSAGRPPVQLWLCALASVVLAFSAPAVSNMRLGQVSFAIAALVLIDATLLPPRWRGTLVGVAGALKLTPLIMVPYYLVTRQWRAAANATAVFAGASLLGAVVRFQDTVHYVTHPEAVRAAWGSSLARPDNWSEFSVLARLNLSGTSLTIAWLLVAGATGVVALWRALLSHQRSRELEATLVMGLAATLVTSATWPHHALFLVVGCLLLAIQRPVLGLVLIVGFVVGSYAVAYYLGYAVVVLMILFVLLGFGEPRPEREPVSVEPAPQA
jgi:alpha-1,2-mannosyltransferase